MDQLPGREEEFVVDLESGGVLSSDSEFTKICSGFSNLDEIEIGLDGNATNVKGMIHLKKLGDEDEERKKQKEKRKSMSSTNNNKPPRRPPRYPKSALSLDAADQRLIKEISHIAMIKHARDERMKALKKMKAAKSSSSSSSSSNMFAMITTFLFCLVLIFQGMSSSKRLTINIQSPHPSWVAENHIVSVNDPINTSTSITNATPSGSLDSLRQSLIQDDDKIAAG